MHILPSSIPVGFIVSDAWSDDAHAPNGLLAEITIVSNHISTKPGGGQVSVSGMVHTCLGHILAHTAYLRCLGWLLLCALDGLAWFFPWNLVVVACVCRAGE